MRSLYRILYEYAAKYKADAFLLADQDELADHQQMVDHALEDLAGMGPQAAELVKQVQDGGDVLADIYGNAHFLAGLSVGMELGRL
ncbi:MAG: hypothetical protein HFF50_08370 [Lawsonibacter sp.]|nr:hypothetical protein [Lawsonibacter sp.]